MKNIVTIKFGSHLYGTNTPTSDLDYKSVHLPDAKSILLGRVQDSVTISGKVKAEGERNLPGDTDHESYSLARYLQLLADGQTVAIDMLFASNKSILERDKEYIWTNIRFNKDKFLSKKSTAFVGYCRTQANKYGIKGSRVAAAKDAAMLFSQIYQIQGATSKVGEFEIYLKKLVNDHTRIFLGGNKDRPEWMFECCNRQVPFGASVKQAYEIYSRIYENYGDRARLAESNEGIDWKALSHAVRVGTEAIELLETGNVTFPMVNASHLLAIKKGELDYKEVAEEIESLLVKVEEVSKASSLPESPDYEFIDSLVEEVYRGVVNS